MVNFAQKIQSIYFVGVESELASIYLRHGLTARYDGEEENAKKLTYLSKVALFDGIFFIV